MSVSWRVTSAPLVSWTTTNRGSMSLIIRRGRIEEVALTRIVRPLTGKARTATAASVVVQDAQGVTVAGPFAAALDPEVGGWVATVAPLTVAAGTVLTVVSSVTVAGVTHSERTVLRVLA